MDVTPSAFEPWHRHDRNFFLSYVILAWVMILIGFAPNVIVRFTGQADFVAPWSLVVHVWSFTGWMCLLTLQVLLVRKPRIDLHRLTGMALLVLLPIMLVSAFLAEVYVERFNFETGRNIAGINFPVARTIFIMSLLLVFGGAASLAFIMRGDPAAHKRLIILATSVILAAATGRLMTMAAIMARGLEDGLAFRLEYDGTFFWAGPIALVAVSALYDRLTRGSIHPVLSTGLVVLIAAYLLTSAVNQSEWWPPMAQRLLGL